MKKRLRLLLALLTAGFSTPLTAQTNQYLDFDGVDDYVHVANGSAVIAGSTAMTITGWFYNTALGYGQGMIGYRAALGEFYMLQLNTGQVECRFKNSAGTQVQVVAPNYTTIPQVWQHFAWVYGGGSVRLYVNGNQVGSSVAASGSISSTTIPFTIGKSLLSGFNFVYNGRIDEVTVWNKALTQAEIQTMMTTEPTGSEPNLQMYFKFNQGVPGGNNTSITTLTSTVNSPLYDGALLHFALNGPSSNFNGTLNPRFQAISFPQIPTQLTTAAPFQLGATASSGLTVSYAVESGPATVSGDTITLTGAGTVRVRASQAGNVSFDSAASVVNSFDVVSPSANVPVIEVRNPLNDSNVYMPALSTMQLAALVSIPYPGLFSVQSVQFSVNGQPVFTESHGNMHYTAWWMPSAFGDDTIQVTATSNFGAVATETVIVHIVPAVGDLNNIAGFSGIWLNPDSSSAVREANLPSYVGAFDTIIATLSVTCPPGGCDPNQYDRVASVDILGHDGQWFEIIRYITPFGVACSHQINLADYMSLLQGRVTLRMNCGDLSKGFVYALQFDFKSGQPPHKYSRVTKIWKDVYPFGDYANLQPVPAYPLSFPAYTVEAKMKLVSTGHGWGTLNTGNAAEFYNTTHFIKVNGNSAFSQHNWVTCNPNPDGCSPQNGTWTYSRAGWCPGSIARYFDFDLSSYIPNSSINLEYQFNPSYLDACHPNNPNCVTGVTCSNCADGFNPSLDVNCNLVTFFDTSWALGLPDVARLSFAVYPNPSNGVFVLHALRPSSTFYAVTVFDIVGNRVRHFRWTGEKYLLDLGGSAKGVYIVRVSDGKEEVFRKLVVQ